MVTIQTNGKRKGCPKVKLADFLDSNSIYLMAVLVTDVN